MLFSCGCALRVVVDSVSEGEALSASGFATEHNSCTERSGKGRKAQLEGLINTSTFAIEFHASG